MNTDHLLTSCCRHCRFYAPEGRRGGTCQQLGVPVQGKWTACSLAASPFAPSFETLDDIVKLEHSLALNCSDNDNHLPKPVKCKETVAIS